MPDVGVAVDEGQGEVQLIALRLEQSLRKH